MLRDTVEFLRSPETGNPLIIEELQSVGDDVIEGRLLDRNGGPWFRIEGGIADLSPLALRQWGRHFAFCRRHNLTTQQPQSQPRAETPYSQQISFFREYHAEYEKDVVDSPFYRILDAVTVERWIKRNLAPGSLVVEIGCGSGRQTLPLLKHGCRVLGIDLSEEMLRVARSKVVHANPKISADFIVASAELLPLQAAVANAAVIYGSLHHFAKPEIAVRNAAKVLRSGGLFYMLEPHDTPLRPLFDWSMRLWTLWKEEAADEPLFNEKQWRAWLDASGISSRITYSTYLPPHVFYVLRGPFGRLVLAGSDRLLRSLPVVCKMAGIIVAEGTRTH